MKTVVRPHLLKDIILEFDESKEQPDFEKDALALYYEAHDVVWDLKQRLEYLAKGLIDANEKISVCYVEARDLDQRLEIVEGEIRIEGTGLFQDLEKHNREVKAIYELVDDMTQRYNQEMDLIDPADEYQAHWPIHGRYFGIFRDVYPRYEELSVNIVSLDDDEQLFLEIYGELSDMYQRNLDFAEEVFESYRRLYELADPMYKRATITMASINQKM